MLVVLALLLIMVATFWSSGSRTRQEQLKKACQKNLQAIYVGLEIYANDHDGAFPVVPGARTAEEPLALLVPHYTADTAPFICPGSGDRALPSAESFAQRTISYAYYMGRRLRDASEVLMTDRQIDEQPKGQKAQVFSTTGKPPGKNHNKYGGNFLFADGRCEMSSAFTPFSLVLTQGVVLLNPKP
jgi:prepilin-type processing-associated H-X9-DG protein